MRKWLVALREAKGYSQSYVARAVGVKQPTYWEYENGTCTPRPATAKKIALLLGFDWRLFYPDEPADREVV